MVFAHVLRDEFDHRTEMTYAALLAVCSKQGCFASYPPLAYLVQAISASGFFAPLIVTDDLDSVERMADDFSGLTGFRRDCSRWFFLSFAFARRLTDECPEYPRIEESADENATMVAEDSVEYGRSRIAGDDVSWNPRWEEAEKCEFLTSIITVNKDNEQRLGVRCSQVACVGVSEYRFKISAELSRVDAMASAQLFAAIYSRDGRVAYVTAIGTLCYDAVSPRPVMTEVPIPPASVGKIMVYWED